MHSQKLSRDQATLRTWARNHNKMKINIKLMGVLKKRTPANGSLELADGATIEDALQLLDISAAAVQVCTVNGTLERDLKRKLEVNDELSVVPPVGGG